MKITLISIVAVLLIRSSLAQTTFKTTDKQLQQLYDKAESKCLGNIREFGKYKVLVEGAGYPNVWLETQPMGGEMYAKRNLAVAKNNQMIFMDFQRPDGRLPGMISLGHEVYADYGWFQGFCFPQPALNVYYWIGKDKAYLQRLYNCLANFDAYLWRVRDADGDGCLETWCVYDNGEDNSVRLDGAPLQWGYDFAPTDSLIKLYHPELQGRAKNGLSPVPLESMDVMSYSYSARITLAEIANLLHNGKGASWTNKARIVQNKIKSYLWDPHKSACFDRDPKNRTVNILLHNNLRCMYYGSFDQQMADAFIAKHLFNPKEFWTYMPLPSIAANDPAFRNVGFNDWSGQSQGLTFQRAITALENYGHYAEVRRVGDRLISVLKQDQVFAQQYDPFTGKTAEGARDGYGPTMLSLLEYISRMYGIHYTKDHIWWSGLNAKGDSTTYSQLIHGKTYTLKTNNHIMTGYIDGKVIFNCYANARLVTDEKGRIAELVGIDSVFRNIKLITPYTPKSKIYPIKPNEVYKL